MMRAITLVDLDDTLFQTQRKCPPDLAPDALTPIGFAADGSPMSFATPQQLSFIRLLAETTHFIPVTARSGDALRRVRIDFAEAVYAHGGAILGTDGAIDREWEAHITTKAANDTDTITQLVAALADAARIADLPVKARIQREGDTGLYALARHEAADEAALTHVADAVCHLLPPGWTDHRNGNAVAFLPPWLGKRHAVAHILPDLRARFPDASVIGIGDSISDAPFMALCDFAMTPTQSQLARAVSDQLAV